MVDGQPIDESQIPPAAQAQLQRMEQQVYMVRRNALGTVIDQKLLAEQARKKGLSVAELLQREVDGHVTDPSDDEVSAYYQAHQTRIHQPLDNVKEEIRQGLKSQKIDQARQTYIQGLVQRAIGDGDLVILLRPPKVAMSYDPARLRGNPGAPVTIVEFADFTCPFCHKAEPTVAALLSKYPGKVKFGYRDFPLMQIHPQAELAAEASRCAGEQGKYWEYHDLLFSNPPEKQDRSSLIEDAASLKLDQGKFSSCVDSGRYKPQIEEDQRLGAASGVLGTPSFFIDGIYLQGAQSLDTLQHVVDQELSAAGHNHPSP